MSKLWEKARGVRISIRYKLIVVVMALALIPLGVATVLARDNAETALSEMGRANQEARAQNTGRVIDEYLNAHLSDAGAMGGMPEMREFAAAPDTGSRRERARAALTAMQKKDPNYESVALLDPDGRVWASSVAAEEGTNLRFRPYFQQALAGKANISDASISVATNRPALFFAAPVRLDNGQVVGVVRAQLNMGGVIKRITDDARLFGRGSTAMLVDEYGIRLAMGDASQNFAPGEGGQLLTSFGEVPEDVRRQLVEDRRLTPTQDGSFTFNPQPKLAAAVASAKQGSTELSGANGQEDVLSFATMTSKPWKYVVTTPREVFTASAAKTSNQLTRVGLLTASVALAVAFVFSLTMTRPIVKLARAADAVSMGDTDATVDVRSNDEIGDLAAAFSRMVASVRFYMSSFHEDEDEEDSPMHTAA